MSFTVDMHYCGDTLVDFSFVQQVKTCGMEKSKTTSSCENPTLSEKSCCTDTQVFKEGIVDLKVSFYQLTLEQQVFVASFTYSYISLFEGTESKQVPFVDYAPPFIRQDVQVLHQTFLI
jgi:glutamine cyclotransferase